MTEAAPANGSPRGRGGFRGRGGRGRGRGSPSRRFRGGRGHTVHTGTVGRSGPVASRGGSFTGNGRGRGTSRGGPAGQARHRILVTETFLEPRQLREFRTTEKNLSLLIGNLPPIRIQDVQEVYDFIAQCTNVRVQKLSFGTSDKYGFLAAKCVLQNDHQLRECLEKLHGQVFRDHHLIVESATSFHFSPFVQAIKISNLSTTVTVEKLWKLFENCGRPKQIRLIPGTHEASVNFEDSDSLLKAMKLDGATLDNACIKVVVLDKNLSVQINPMDELYLQSVLKDLNIVHITHSVKKNIKTGIVYFSDEESFTAACNLDGKNWDGHTISVKPNFKHNLYLTGSSGHIERLLSEVQSLFNATRSYLLGGRVGVLAFTSKEEADNALKASPVLVGNKSVTLYDDLSKIRSSMDGNRDFDRGVHVVSKPSNGVEKLEKQLPKVKAKVEKTLKNNKKQSKKAGVVIGGAVSEPSSLNTVPKQAPQVDGEEEMMKESKKIKRKMKKLTEASGVVSKPSDGVLEKQQSSDTDLKRKRNEPKTHKKTGGKKIKISP